MARDLSGTPTGKDISATPTGKAISGALTSKELEGSGMSEPFPWAFPLRFSHKIAKDLSSTITTRSL